MIILEQIALSAHKSYTQKPSLNDFHMHTHDNYEIYCFLSGAAKYFVEGNIYNLKPGDILIIQKAEVHSLLINADTPYERIYINFNHDALLGENTAEALSFLDNKPLGKNNRYSASKFKDMHWMYYLEKICSTEDIYEKRLYLTVLVRELHNHYPEICEDVSYHDSISDIIEYINLHLTEQISLETVCKHFFLSKSHLNRKFKRMTGSTVWKYVLNKRLLFAKELLQNGEHPTAVHIKSGFNDYCSFFRAYKSKFGVSPKNDYNHDYRLSR